MTKGEFIQYLKSPENLNEAATEAISSIRASYPYFQSAQLLLSKGYQNTDHLQFEKQLKKAAAYAADRKLLHQLIMGDQINAQFQQSSEPEVEEVEHEKNQTTDRSPEDKPNDESSASKDIPAQTEDRKTEEDELLERQILAEAVNNSILQEADDQIPEIDSFTRKTLEKETIEIEKSAQTEESFNQDEEHEFSAWLNFYRMDQKKDQNEDSRKEKALWDQSKVADIQKQLPQDAVVKKEFYSAAKMARLSVQEDDDLVTETLASIYSAQGKFEKAIHAYKKLQLKYPEKRSYFANRIKNIEEQLKS